MALLLLGLLVGGVVGYLTRPGAAEIRIGGTTFTFSDNRVSSGPPGHLTADQSRHIFIYAAVGGIIALLAGFAVGRR